MASVTGISSASFYTNSVQSTLDKQMKPAADLLGMTVTDAQTAVRGGKTLADLAKTKGVSEDDLEAAISKGLQENPPAGGTALTAAQADSVATAIATGKPPANGISFSSNKSLMDYIQDDADASSSSDGSLASILNPSTSASTTGTSASATTSAKSLDALAKALGVDTATLSKQLQSGDTSSLSAEISAKFGKTAGIQFDAAL